KIPRRFHPNTLVSFAPDSLHEEQLHPRSAYGLGALPGLRHASGATSHHKLPPRPTSAEDPRGCRFHSLLFRGQQCYHRQRPLRHHSVASASNTSSSVTAPSTLSSVAANTAGSSPILRSNPFRFCWPVWILSHSLVQFSGRGSNSC